MVVASHGRNMCSLAVALSPVVLFEHIFSFLIITACMTAEFPSKGYSEI
jgi:hypothetical protein